MKGIPKLCYRIVLILAIVSLVLSGFCKAMFPGLIISLVLLIIAMLFSLVRVLDHIAFEYKNNTDKPKAELANTLYLLVGIIMGFMLANLFAL